ncbi:Alpha crystallin/Hsp20 domain [Dillenia turbinata]|uniref:Alpha crystallin/Hsp20 domain n=1 Tax=Dillenia turbinata TaxID=194707 RepID=A0AAN8ZIH6_9MAGN
MDPNAGAALQPDFEPYCQWKREAECETLVIHLPEFRKENLKVVLKSSGLMRISGEREVAERKWSRFQKEIKVPKDCKEDEIQAKFMGGYLYITMPKKVPSSTTKKDNKTIPEAPQGPAIPQALPEFTPKGTCGESVVAGTTTAMPSGTPCGTVTMTVSRRVLVLAAGLPAAAAVGFVLGALVAYAIYGPSCCQKIGGETLFSAFSRAGGRAFRNMANGYNRDHFLLLEEFCIGHGEFLRNNVEATVNWRRSSSLDKVLLELMCYFAIEHAENRHCSESYSISDDCLCETYGPPMQFVKVITITSQLEAMHAGLSLRSFTLIEVSLVPM